MLSPDSGCNLTFGTVKTEDTVDGIKVFVMYLYIYMIILSLKKKAIAYEDAILYVWYTEHDEIC